MATQYIVRRGTATDVGFRSTEDPAQALAWARTSGPLAYVVAKSDEGKRIVWTTTHESRNLGILQQTVLSQAVAAVTAVTAGVPEITG